MRLNLTVTLLTSALVASAMAACDTDSNPAPDTRGGADTASAGTDSAGGGSDTAGTGSDTAGGTTDSTGGGTDTGPSPEGCSRSGFDIVNQRYESQTGYTTYQAVNSAGEPFDAISIEVYTGGDFAGATGPGTYSLDDPNYRTCSNCVLIYADCSGERCEKTFYADAGDLVIDRWDVNGGRFSGTLRNLKLKEVTIDSDTYDSTVVAGGETWCLDAVPFDAEIKALPTSDRTQPSCVADGTGNLLDDNVKAVTWTNCLGETVALHDSCGQAKAFWLVATAGWCSACTQFLGELVSEHGGGTLTRAAVREKTPGLDMLVVLAENAESEKPTLPYCLSYAEQRKLDPAMVVVDWSDTEVQVPLIEPEGSAISTQALATTWGAINPYLSADGNGQVMSSYPWWAVLDGRNMRYHWSDNAQRSDFQTAVGELLSAE
jgi:hypothetical protein